MHLTVRQLATLVSGEVVGNREIMIHSARALEEAQPGDITLLEDPGHVADLQRSKADAAVVPPAVPSCAKALIRVNDPCAAFAWIFQHFRGPVKPSPTGIDPGAVIHETVRVGADASIADHVVIGANTRIGKRCRLHAGVVVGKNCYIGDDVVLHPRTAIYDDTVIGDRVIIRAGAVIGADGFGYRFQKGRHVKVPQLGNVVISDDVEIGAGTAVDRATFGSTRIGPRTRVGSLAQIAHNCQIGADNILGSQVGIGGSSSTGDDVVLGDYAGIKDHIEIGHGITLAPRTGVVQDVPAGTPLTWYPAHAEGAATTFLGCLNDLLPMREMLRRVVKEVAVRGQESGQRG